MHIVDKRQVIIYLKICMLLINYMYCLTLFKPGPGARLEDMATKASASLPECIKMTTDLNIREDTKIEVKKLLNLINVEVRLLDGIALPPLFP